MAKTARRPARPSSALSPLQTARVQQDIDQQLREKCIERVLALAPGMTMEVAVKEAARLYRFIKADELCDFNEQAQRPRQGDSAQAGLPLRFSEGNVRM